MTEQKKMSDVIIHVTTSEKADKASEKRSKRLSSNQPNSLSKRKRTTDPSEVTAQQSPPSGIPQEPKSDLASSYRHLFSFGTKQTDHQVGDTSEGKVTAAPQQFSLFGETGNDEHVDGNDYENDGDRDFAPEDAMKVEMAQGNQSLDIRHARDVGYPRNQYQEGEHLDDRVGATNRTTLLAKAQPIPFRDDFDFTRDNVLGLAMNFCRNENIEVLEERWCAVNGIREQMRADFRVKRQNVLKGRKLGTNTTAALR